MQREKPGLERGPGFFALLTATNLNPSLTPYTLASVSAARKTLIVEPVSDEPARIGRDASDLCECELPSLPLQMALSGMRCLPRSLPATMHLERRVPARR
jgi:hypothetical protein